MVTKFTWVPPMRKWTAASGAWHRPRMVSAAAAQRGSMPYPTVCSRLVSVSAWRTAGWAPSL